MSSRSFQTSFCPAFLQTVSDKHGFQANLTMQIGTRLFQPADMGLQRIIKHLLQQETLDFLVHKHTKQIKAGCAPKEVEIPTKIRPLCDATVAVIEHVWDWLNTDNGWKIVKCTWERCKAGEWNLEAKCLTSKKATKGLIEYLCTHPGLHNEIEKHVGDIGTVIDLKHQELEDAELNNFSNLDDHTDVLGMCVLAS
jgi:hypothetical protein